MAATSHNDPYRRHYENEEFKFEGYQRTVLIGFMVLGLVCLGLTWMDTSEPFHARFWSNVLHNTVYFTGFGFIAIFCMCAFITAYAGWYAVIKRIWEAYSMFLIFGLGLLMIIGAGIWMGWHNLYHWADPTLVEEGHANYDKIMVGKAPFLNKSWWTFGTLIIVGMWYAFSRRLRSLSLSEDRNGDDDKNNDFKHHRKMRLVAGIFLPLAAFSSAAMIWQWVMSIDSHWYSTMFAWYATASWFVGAMSLTILILLYLKSKGYYKSVTPEHIHDLGKFIFAFSIFWAYLWFSQFMLIWYANVGEETIYFRHRLDNYPFLFWANLAMNFALPFFILMRNSTKRKFGTVGFAAALLLFSHWFDFFQMIKPGVLHTTHEMSHGGHHGGGDHHDSGHGFIQDENAPKAVFTGLIDKDQNPLKKKLEQAGDKVEQAANKVGDAAEKAANKVGEAATQAGNAVEQAAHKAGEHVENAAHKAGEHLEKAGQHVDHAIDHNSASHDGHGGQDHSSDHKAHNNSHDSHSSHGDHGAHNKGHDGHKAHSEGHAAHGHDGHGGDAHGHDAHGHDDHGHSSHAVPYTAGFTLPGLLELGTFLGFLAMFLFIVFTSLASAKLEPKNDPYLEESYHHHS